ncbi:MAG: DUF2795 domain-containing protein [Candidatus Zixiibacteriota bacterium]|nr:MAG: DUF2795 domain-containing protein [candidate division Zixibacteria bacterium]
MAKHHGSHDSDVSVSPAQVEKYLRGINYPASKRDLQNHARRNNAPEDVMDTLDMMPDRQYHSADDVAEGISEVE